jgi:hypothetical protein
MLRATLLTSAAFALSGAFAVTHDASAQPAALTAAQIVEKNIAARGGLNEWRGVQTMSWSGKLDAGGNNQRVPKRPGEPPAPPRPAAESDAPQVQLPFVLEMARGRKSRLEIDFAGQTAVQVFDGAQGWKVRPFLNRYEVEPFRSEEVEAAEMQADLDGALVDYAAKGTRIELVGVEKVEGRDAYKLELTLQNQRVVHTWIDAKSFLDVKMDGTPRRLDGKEHAVAVFLRDYRTVNGLQIPHLMETVVEGLQRTQKIRIEKVVVNPNLDASRFVKPS